MSEIITDKLTGKTSAGDVTITSEGGSATMQLQQGLAKAWNNTNNIGTVINDSFAISSLTDVDTGRQEHNVTNSFGNNYFVPTFSVADNNNQQWTSQLTTSKWRTSNYTGSAYADTAIRTVAQGDLA